MQKLVSRSQTLFLCKLLELAEEKGLKLAEEKGLATRDYAETARCTLFL